MNSFKDMNNFRDKFTLCLGVDVVMFIYSERVFRHAIV